MKNIESVLLAKRYAIAFLNIYFKELSGDDLDNLQSFNNFIKTNRIFYVCLRLPSINVVKTQEIIDKIFELFSLKRSFKKLLMLLLDDGRIEILGKVIDKILIIYRQRSDISFFDVFTSHDVSDLDKNRIIKFIDGISTGRVVADFKLDKNLIAGFRIQSNNLLWERSMAKQLRDVKRSVFKQVGIW